MVKFFRLKTTISITILVIIVIIFIIFNSPIKTVVSSDCIVVKEGNSSNPLNVVFLSYKYTDDNRFFSDVNSYVFGSSGFSAVEPIRDNMEKFNFYAILTNDLECYIEDQTLLCDDTQAKKIAKKCPNDYIFILGDRSAFLDFVNPVRSSAYLNVASINTADNKLVVLHEFGHFRGLVDEYVEDSYNSLQIDEAPNCDNEDCNKWFDFKGTGCYKGCARNDFYRSQEFTIMRNYFKSNKFGVYNEWLINKSLQ